MHESYSLKRCLRVGKRGFDRKKILVIAAGGLLIVAMVLGVVIPVFSGLGGSSSLYVGAEGVYIFKNGKWRRIDTKGNPWVPSDNATYLVYFKNLECSHCRAFDPSWVEYVKDYSIKDNVTPVEIVCTWFTQQCDDQSARISFDAYARLSNGNFGTPWLVLFYNRSIIYYYLPPVNQKGEFSAELVHQVVVKSIMFYEHPEMYNRTSGGNSTS